MDLDGGGDYLPVIVRETFYVCMYGKRKKEEEYRIGLITLRVSDKRTGWKCSGGRGGERRLSVTPPL